MNFAAYAPGGNYFNALRDQFGIEAANYVAGIASAEDADALRNALSAVRSARRTGGNAAEIDARLNQADTSTLGNFATQITTDPLAAPLDSLNNQISKAVGNVFKNPMVLLLVVAGIVAVVFYAGGLANIKRKFL